MTQTPTRFEALKMVRAAFPTEQAMADAFGVSQPTIWRWLNQSKQIPAEHVLQAEAVSSIPRHLLRPDIYPVDLPPAPVFHGVDRGQLRVSFETRPVSQRTGNRRATA
jgi:DNA-binding transcriptional regulator YdaS (Cro superfamily)